MGEPAFKIRDVIARHNVRVLSSNYTLYGDMSARVDSALESFSQRIENYSIDESFLDLADVPAGDVGQLARSMRATVKRWTGIPTCVGIGPMKTLAKLANAFAKDRPELAGVCDLRTQDAQAKVLATFPVGKVWGVAPAYVERLAQHGVTTAAELRDMPLDLARQVLTVVGMRTVAELRGVSCLPLELAAPAPKNTAVTRSFGARVRPGKT